VRRCTFAILAASWALGCGAGGMRTTVADRSEVPLTLGHGARFVPPALGAARTTAGLPCGPRPQSTFGVHLELFAGGRVVQVPAGIGIAPPVVRRGAYVTRGRCWHPLHTTEPTGLIEIADGTRATLGTLFAVWRQPLSATRLAGFRGSVRAFVGGRPRRGDPSEIPLGRHAQIVLEVGPLVPPHPSYRFPPGL
jgi:hypothetical protein